jgi:CRP-like cAMP-binding protein
MVVDGELAVQRGGQEVARLGPGDHFGELAVTDSTTRDATIVSTSPVELLLNIDGDASGRWSRAAPRSCAR